MDVQDASTVDSGDVIQWTCSCSANQQFRFTPLRSARTSSQATEAIKVFPNPFSTSFAVKVLGNFIYVIKDIQGVVREKGAGNSESTLGQTLKPGLDILLIQLAEATKELKLIKN